MSSFPTYRQLDSMDCGPTCLRMIARYYGRTYSIQKLREKSFITRTGVSMLGISDAAESIGLRTSGVKITFEQLTKENPTPCILHWNQNHFVVCYDIRKKNNGEYKIKISDPVGEKYTLDEKGFLKHWISEKLNGEDFGTALLLSPTPDFYNQDKDEKNKNSRSFAYFFQYIIPYRSQIFQLVVGMLIGSILSLILPFLTQAMVDQGIAKTKPIDSIWMRSFY